MQCVNRKYVKQIQMILLIVSYDGRWLFKKFGRSVLQPNTFCDGLNPLLLINVFLAHTAQARAVS